MSLASLLVARMVGAVYTDVAGDASLSLALTNGMFGGVSVMVCGGIGHEVKLQSIVEEVSMTGVRYRDEIIRPVAVPLVQRRQLIIQQGNTRPDVARVYRDFLANNSIVPLGWPPYSSDLSRIEHFWDDLNRRVRKRQNQPNTFAQSRNNLVDEWNNIQMRTVNALVTTIQRMIRAEAAAIGRDTLDMDHFRLISFPVIGGGVPTNEHK